jgi:hypothetical protein
MSICLVLGSALTMWEDVEAALSLGPVDGIVAAKGAGVVWQGPLDAWVTLHPDRFPKDFKAREAKGYPEAPVMAAHRGHPQARMLNLIMEYKFAEQHSSGSSGLFAVKVAQHIGFTRQVLCGIPLDKKAGKIGVGPHWAGAEGFKRGFKEAKPHLINTRSMSGWTAEFLGKPDEQFFTGV